MPWNGSEVGSRERWSHSGNGRATGPSSGSPAVVESGFDEGLSLRVGEGQVAQSPVLGVPHVGSGLVFPGFWTLVRAAAVAALVPVTHRRSSPSRRGWLRDLLWVAGGPLERSEQQPALKDTSGVGDDSALFS